MLRLRADGSVDKKFGFSGEAVGEQSTFAGAHVLADGSIETVGRGYRATRRPSTAGPAGGPLHRRPANPIPRSGPEGMELSARRTGKQAKSPLGAPTVRWSSAGSSKPRARMPAKNDATKARRWPPSDPEGTPDPASAKAGSYGSPGSPDRPGSPSHQRQVEFGVTALARRPDGSIVAVGGARRTNRSGSSPRSRQGAHSCLLRRSRDRAGVRTRPPPQGVAGIAPMADGGLLAAGRVRRQRRIASGPGPLRGRRQPRPDLRCRHRVRRPSLEWSAGGVRGRGRRGAGRIRSLSATPSADDAHRDGSPVTTFGSGGSVALPPSSNRRRCCWNPTAIRSSSTTATAEHPACSCASARTEVPTPPSGTAARFSWWARGRRSASPSSLRPGEACSSVAWGGGGSRSPTCCRTVASTRYDGSHGWSVVSGVGKPRGSSSPRSVPAPTSPGTCPIPDPVASCLARLDLHGHLDRGFGRHRSDATSASRARLTATRRPAPGSSSPSDPARGR